MSRSVQDGREAAASMTCKAISTPALDKGAKTELNLDERRLFNIFRLKLSINHAVRRTPLTAGHVIERRTGRNSVGLKDQ